LADALAVPHDSVGLSVMVVVAMMVVVMVKMGMVVS
jgi:hypothetical protein